MDWRKGRRSRNVEDRRGQTSRGGFGAPAGGMRLKGGSLLLVMVLIFFFGDSISGLLKGGEVFSPATPSTPTSAPASGRTGQVIDPAGRDVFAEIFGNAPSQSANATGRTPREQIDDIFSGIDDGNLARPADAQKTRDVLDEILSANPESSQRTPPQSRSNNDVDADFVSAILGSTEDVWRSVFGNQYPPAKLVLYDGRTPTACGTGRASSGPFYCPADRKVYLDLDFFQELAKMGGKGDFAQAYVLGHEVAHHVQQITGTTAKMRQLQQRYPRSKNELSVMLELQADCLAGVWANHSHRSLNWLDAGDLQEGLAAASAVGDDRITRGMIPAESFTHGSAAQRQEWLMRGVQTGDVRSCNTFKVMANLDGF